MSVIYSFVIFCLFARTSSYSRVRRVDIVSSCPSVETFSEFDQTKHMGTWYSNGMFNTINLSHSQCNTEHWTAVKNGELSIVETYFDESADGHKTENMFDALVLDSFEPERFRVCFHNQSDYCSTNWILKTDYISYSVQYFCQFLTTDDGDISVPVIRIMLRERNSPKDVIDKAMEFISQRGFNISNYMETNQTSCERIDVVSNREEVDKNSVKREKDSII